MTATSFSLSRLTSVSALLTVSVVLAGCGNGSGSSGLKNRYRNEIPADNLTAAQRQAQKTEVSCADPEDCQPSVGMLISTTDSSLGSCTASLLGPDLVVTNSHCIPEDLKHAGSSCDGRMTLFFPGSATYRSEKVECASVISASELDPGNELPDYAFIRLKSTTSRPVLGFSGEGFSDQKKYLLPKVDPRAVDGHFSGTLYTVKCNPVYDTVLIPGSRSKDSALMVFANCSVIHGNSGSPILDEKGEIRGVIQATLERSAISSLMRSLTGEYLDGSVNEMGVGTNLGCVSAPGVLPEHEIAKGCEIGEKISEQNASVKRRAEVLLKKMLAHVEGQTRTHIPMVLNSVFEWDVGSRNTQTFGDRPGYLVIPKCFKPGDGWLSSFKNFLGFTKGSTDIDVKMPYWEVRKGFNRNLQQDVRLSDLPQGYFTLKFSFSPDDFKDDGHAKVKIKDMEKGVFGNSTVLEKDIKLCR